MLTTFYHGKTDNRWAIFISLKTIYASKQASKQASTYVRCTCKVMKIMPVQKQTSAGQNSRFVCYVQRCSWLCWPSGRVLCRAARLGFLLRWQGKLITNDNAACTAKKICRVAFFFSSAYIEDNALKDYAFRPGSLHFCPEFEKR